MEFQVNNIDLNAFPFKLRYSNNNKIYHEIQDINDELLNVFQKMNTEIRDKTEIKRLLRESFASVGPVLRKILNFYDSSSCPIESIEEKSNLRKQMEEKLLCYFEDERESMYFDRTKEVAVEICPIPANWKCRTWQKFSTKIDASHHQSHQYPADKFNKKKTDGMEDNYYDQLFSKDLQEIYSSINTLNHRIQLMRNHIHLLSENVTWLHSNFKEYFKILVKFNRQFPSDESDTVLQSIKSDIAKVFEVERKINFAPDYDSPRAYEFLVNENDGETVRLELKVDSDPKNLLDLNNFIGGVYIDDSSNIPSQTNLV